MLKHILKALASLFTLVGGHFLNRRFDRAVLFFSVFLLSIFGIYYGLFVFMAGSTMDEYYQFYQQVLNSMAYVGFGVLTVSAIVTFLDSYRTADTHQTSWSVSGRVGAVLMSLLGFIGSVYLLLLLSAVNFSSSEYKLSDDGSKIGTTSDFMSDQFYASAHYGSTGGYNPNAKPPPKGEGYLVGAIEYAGQPAVGIRLKLTLNNRYITRSLVTDEKGQVVLRVPPGDWAINSIETNQWSNKPRGEFELISGEEPVFTGGYYSNSVFRSEGKVVKVTASLPTTPQLQVTVHKRLEMLRPDKRDRQAVFSLEKDAFIWHAYPGAHQYQVNIIGITHDGNTTSYKPIANMSVQGATQLSLNKFKTVSKEQGSQEYKVQVIAFTEDGRYLSASDESFGSSYSFTLSEKRAFVREQDRSFGQEPVDGEQVEAWFNNGKKLDAIELLINENLHDPARKLLDGLDAKDTRPGRKAVMLGYWYASQGKCKEAEVYFNQARKEGGSTCVTTKYMKGCY